MGYMVNKIIILLLVVMMSSVCYANISNVTIEDVKDHARIADKLNEIIKYVNKDINSKADKKTVDLIQCHYQTTSQDLQILRGNLYNIRSRVGDPTGTVGDIRTKFLLLMDTIDSSPTPQHK